VNVNQSSGPADDELERALQQLYRTRAETPDQVRLLERVHRIPDDLPARSRPRWLRLGVRQDDHASPQKGRSLTMNGVVRLAAAGTILAIVGVSGTVGVLGPRFAMHAGRTIVVDPDGSAEATTIDAALALASDGDTIEVRPGTYHEALTITGDITIAGTGSPGGVVIDVSAAERTVTFDGGVLGLGILLQGSDAVLRGLDITGGPETLAVHIDGGAPTLDGVTVSVPGEPSVALLLSGGTTAAITNGQLSGYVKVQDSSPTIAGTTVHAPGISVDLPASQPVLRDNTFVGPTGISFSWGSGGLVDSNQFGLGGEIGIDTGADPIIRGNTFDGGGSAACASCSGSAIRVSATHWSPENEGLTGVESSTAAPVIENNDIGHRAIGIDIRGEFADPLVRGNAIHDNAQGIAITGGAARVMDNDLTRNPRGISASLSAAVIEDNLVSESATGIRVAGRDIVLRRNHVEGSGTGYQLDGGVTIVEDNTSCGNEIDVQLNGAPVDAMVGITTCLPDAQGSTTP
jgi:hypothetical protein